MLCRYAATRWLGPAPWPVFLVNLSGCLLIGLLHAFFFDAKKTSADAGLSPVWGTALTTGFLGGFTTFSTYSLETLLLWENGRRWLALFYGVLSPVLGVASAWLGLLLGRFFSK